MAAPPSDDDDEWKISVDDVGPPAHHQSEASEESEEPEDETDSNIAGTLSRDQPLEPGDIDAENAAFVVLGVLLVVVLIVGAIVGI
jgi:hypothetical protein